jgi:hypothetical protein
VTSPTRAEGFSALPRVGEFVAGYEASQWYGLAAPKNTPVAVIDKLNREINAALNDPAMQAKVCRDRRRSACRLAGRVRSAHRRGNREVGQGGEVHGAQAAVTPPPLTALGHLRRTDAAVGRNKRSTLRHLAARRALC